MIKIKDGVKFTTLKKFGFKEPQNELYKYYEYNNGSGTKIYVFYGGKISIFLDKYAEGDKSLDVIYDLIKANLVEKVEENK